jgi:hypothetical protein
MEVTRHTIVYAAVQVCGTISYLLYFAYQISDDSRQLLYPIEQWKCYDGNFDQEAFFKNIVKLFETNPGHCGVKETLVWWNQYVCLFIE